ncbi:MAG: acyl-CoA dehydrogenase family protein [Spongiibacteraceae bacterium]
MQEQDEFIGMLEDSARRFVLDSSCKDHASLWPAIAELGWLGLCLPESHGGTGLGVSGASALTRLFGQAALPNRFSSYCVIPSHILSHVTTAHPIIKDLCEELILGSALLTLAWQEHEGQFSPDRIDTKLNNGTLNGSKLFVAGADIATQFLVTAKQDNEQVVLLINREAEGVRIEQVYESDGGFATVHFTDVTVDESALLLSAENASIAVTNSIEAGRIAISAELEGLAHGCLEATLEFVKTRNQFKQAIGSFQSIRHRCVDLLIATRLSESSWRKALTKLPLDEAQVSAAKARCGETAIKVAKESIQMHGAMGFTEEAGIGRYLRAAMAQSGWLGSPRQHRERLMNTISPKELIHA